jgi:hypothetical protein
MKDLMCYGVKVSMVELNEVMTGEAILQIMGNSGTTWRQFKVILLKPLGLESNPIQF